MTGNCVGWCAYAYYTRDAFVLAANLPGLLVSFWLNFGAIKIQYLETVDVQKRDESTGEGEREKLTMVPQETTLLRVLVVWSFVLLWVGWLHPAGNAAHFVGLVVNVNLVCLLTPIACLLTHALVTHFDIQCQVFFYGAPLNTIRQVLSEKNSNSIHCPTMVLNWVNTSFWLVYGFARRDLIIMIPNGLGLLLGLSQGVLSLLYPRTGRNHEDELDNEEASRNSLIV